MCQAKEKFYPSSFYSYKSFLKIKLKQIQISSQKYNYSNEP